MGGVDPWAGPSRALRSLLGPERALSSGLPQAPHLLPPDTMTSSWLPLGLHAGYAPPRPACTPCLCQSTGSLSGPGPDQGSRPRGPHVPVSPGGRRSACGPCSVPRAFLTCSNQALVHPNPSLSGSSSPVSTGPGGSCPQVEGSHSGRTEPDSWLLTPGASQGFNWHVLRRQLLKAPRVWEPVTDRLTAALPQGTVPRAEVHQ